MKSHSLEPVEVAFVEDTAPAVGGIIMDSSTLEIRNHGILTVAPGSSAAGNIVLGQSVATNLVIRHGGTLTAQNITTGGGTATQLVLGETTGTGSSTLSVTGGTLNRITKVVGPNVSFSSSGGLTFGAAGTLVPVITGTSHSAISVAGTARLGGTVRPEFSGSTPTLGSSWNLVTAGQIAGSFTLDASSAPEAPRGAGFYITQSADNRQSQLFQPTASLC